MLEVRNISKQYRTGDLVQKALDGVSLCLRDNEFVSILGPSGSGKTTLLNVIGGLDRYDSGDLIINGTSTKKYKDRDWDTYRNHTIGFVFQSYNLIPHQTVLANVELALTIGGLSRGERKKLAKKALTEVGLGDQLHKKPNQMSGGQMQRVAIARALVNDPDILLADEPTGALDSETSVQVMELLKRVAKDRLVVMVTHNPELAREYSTRIVRLRDGKIVGDTDPCYPDDQSHHRVAEAEENSDRVVTLPGYSEPVRIIEYRDGKIYKGEAEVREFDDDLPAERTEKTKLNRKRKKAKMSFLTALSLSFNNLKTKKGRTILTAFAGSIGIIGIALILALSTGVNKYITDLQRDTMTSYPITISAETLDLSGMMSARDSMMGAMTDEEARSRVGVYADYLEIETSEAMMNSIKQNNLNSFKKYLDDPDSEIQQYLGENGVSYTYSVDFSVYSRDKDGKLVDSDADVNELSGKESGGFSPMANMRTMASLMGGTTSGAANFSQLMAGHDGSAVSSIITDSYDVLYGRWCEDYDEVVLVVDSRNTLSAPVLYQLGFITESEYKDLVDVIENGGDPEELKWDYSDACDHTFYLVPASYQYEKNGEGVFAPIELETGEEALLENAVELNITGIIRPKQDAANAMMNTAVAYTEKLTDYIIRVTDESPIIKAQESDRETNVLSGMTFEAANDGKKVEDAKEYISSLGVSDKASLYTLMMYYSAGKQQDEEGEVTEPVASEPEVTEPESEAGEEQEELPEGFGGGYGSEALPETLPEGYDPAAMGGEYPADAAGTASAAGMGYGRPMDETSMAEAMDMWLENDPDEEFLINIYDNYVGGATYDDNMKTFGKVSYDTPATISIYTDSFEDKESLSACIENYNKGVEEEEKITYTDYVALLTSSITTMVNAISYVLIAFVAVSLIVSCIMIGIITHISVMERTKEIGILRALGASKRNISQVFNAETIIIGLCAGLIGVGASMLLTVPINSIIQRLLSGGTLKAFLDPTAAVVLIAISVIITVIGGLLPAKNAAKKDPVTALRTE